MDLGGAFFNWSYCVLCVLSDTLALGCMMFVFCVKEAHLGMMAFVACSAPWLSEYYTTSFRMYHAQCNASATPFAQATLDHWFRQFLAIYGCLDKGVGVCILLQIHPSSSGILRNHQTIEVGAERKRNRRSCKKHRPDPCNALQMH